MTGERGWTSGRALGAWLASPLFARQLIDFLLLWIVFKGVNGFTAVYAHLPPLAFRPGAEVGALAIECVALVAFLRRNREDLLLAGLGLDWPLILLPFGLIHTGLSLAAAAIG